MVCIAELRFWSLKNVLSEHFELVGDDFALDDFGIEHFAVRFELAVVKHFDLDFARGVFFGVISLDVFALQEFGQLKGDASFFHFIDDDNVEFAVVGDAVGAYRHAAAYALSVAYAYHKR